MMTTYTVISAAAEILAKGLDKKAAAAMVRSLGGPTAATFRAEEDTATFDAPEQFTARQWAATLRNAGYMRRR